MKELAEQELKILEAQHPTRFQHLKLELKAFIHLLDDEEEEQSFKRKQLSILTQESSSREHEREERKNKRGRRKRRREEEELSGAIQKAEACLRKIETLKSLFRPSNG